MRNCNFLLPHRAQTVAAAAILSAIAAADCASAYTLKTLHAFCAQDSCPDGGSPLAGLLMDGAGDLYGTTYIGGKYGQGIVFKLIPNGDGTYKEYILHNFCARMNCTDGDAPRAGLIMDVDGNLYGTTGNGGKFGGGVIFKLTHGANGWSLNVLHSFCGSMSCSGGSFPNTGLVYAGQASGALWDKFSPLFGTAPYGGSHGKGVAYKLAEDGSLWDYEIIHNFDAPGSTETVYPSPPFVDASGNLFGLTESNGKFGGGVLYKLAAGSWTETVLHNFCDPAVHCADGLNGFGPLAVDASGTLFGTRLASYCDQHGCDGSIAFAYTASGNFSVIHRFCASCGGGYDPAGVIIDAAGNLYGTTEYGGKGDDGLVFELSYDIGQQRWIGKTVHVFCPGGEDCKNGDAPLAAPILDSEGNL